MKVAWIITGFAKDETDYNGAPSIHKTAELLSFKKNIELDIYTLYYPFYKSEYNYFNAKVYSFAKKENISRADKYIIWKNAEKKFSEENRINRYDIIHSIWSGESGNLGAKLCEKNNIPFITSVCGGELAEISEIKYGNRLKYWQKKFVNTSFKKADKIIIGSDYIYDKIKKYYNDNILQKTIKIPFGVDDKLFYPFESSTKYKNRFPILLNIASAVPVKNHIMLMNAFSKVKQRFPNALLIICGYDKNNILPNLIQQFNLEDSVKLKGFIPYEDIPDIINSADIFVLSSFYESQNLSILESAFCGIPSASTRVGIAEEITEYISEINNLKEFTNKIISLTENIETTKKKLKEKLNKLREAYSIKSTSEIIYNLYKMISALNDKH